MPALPSSVGASGPSTFDKAKMGAMMGGSVGTIIGLIFGATNIIRFGPGPNGILRTLGQYMLGSAATFGFFMSIGTTIRTESSPITTAAYARAESSMDYNEFRYLYYATFVIPFLSCIPPKTPPVRYKDTERRMTMPTNSQIEGMYGAIKELRTSLNAFEHLVSAHLDEFGKQVKQLEQNTCTNPKEDKQRESGKRSALTAQPHVRLLASNEAQELSAPPLIKKQTHKIEKPSARNVQREESPCPPSKEPQKSRLSLERRPKFAGAEQRAYPAIIPSKRGHSLDSSSDPPSRKATGPQLDPLMKKPRTVQPNIIDQSKNKNEKQKQKEQNDITNRPAIHPRFDHASVKSDTLRPANPSQNLYPQASQAKEENLPVVDSGMKPVIKMEERKMWRTTWTAEGSKEPFDKYIIRKRNEVMDAVARPETDAKSGASAEAGLKRTDKHHNLANPSQAKSLTNRQIVSEKVNDIVALDDTATTAGSKNPATKNKPENRPRGSAISHSSVIINSSPKKITCLINPVRPATKAKNTDTTDHNTKASTNTKTNVPGTHQHQHRTTTTNSKNSNNSSNNHDKKTLATGQSTSTNPNENSTKESKKNKNNKTTTRSKSKKVQGAKKNSDADSNSLFFNSSSTNTTSPHSSASAHSSAKTADTNSPKLADLDGIMRKFGARKG